MVTEKNKGNLIVISGPSGCGKGTIVKNLKDINKNIWVSISMTTREKRPKEIEGEDYYYIDKDSFKKMIENNDFLEWASYNDNYYGTPIKNIEEKLNSGFDVILEIEIQGAVQIQNKINDAIFIFIMPPSMKELKNRLEGRRTESKEKLLKRFKTAYNEINEYTKYNYVVVNDNVEIATHKVNAILLAEHCRVDRIEEIYVDSVEEEIHEALVDKDVENIEREIKE